MKLTFKALAVPALAVGALLASPASAAGQHHKRHHTTHHRTMARHHSTVMRHVAMARPMTVVHHKIQPMRPVPPPRPPLSVAPAVQ